LQVFVGIKYNIIRNTRKFPHPIKIEGIFSLDYDILERLAKTAPIKIEGI
jgi:hypothetical protein